MTTRPKISRPEMSRLKFFLIYQGRNSSKWAEINSAVIPMANKNVPHPALSCLDIHTIPQRATQIISLAMLDLKRMPFPLSTNN